MAARCVCCDVELRKGAGELHHFPIPKRHGGSDTIPLCRGCHDKVDRYAVEGLSGMESMGAVAGLIDKADASERCFLLRMVSAYADALAVAK